MREFDLPSTNLGGKGHHLRRMSAGGISTIQISAPNYAAGMHPSAPALAAFFLACFNAAKVLGIQTPAPAFIAARTYSIAAGANQPGPAVNLGGSAGAVTYTTSDATKATVNAATGAVTPVAIGSATITATVAATATFAAASTTFLATVVA